MFLFAQWSLAAHACPVLRSLPVTPAQLHHAAAERSDAAMQADDMAGLPCHQPAQPSDPVCQKHCDADEQIAAGALDFALPPSSTPVLDVPVRPLRDAIPAPRKTALATAPPLTILYCVSLS